MPSANASNYSNRARGGGRGRLWWLDPQPPRMPDAHQLYAHATYVHGPKLYVGGVVKTLRLDNRLNSQLKANIKNW